MPTHPNVFTIPPTAPFLPTLAAAIIDGKLIPGYAPRANIALLADATVYLPTRRAARALSQALLDALGVDAILLPRIVPLGDVDEEAFAFESAALAPLPPALAPAHRRLALAKLIERFATSQPGLLPGSPSAAIALADELAHLMDDFITADIPFSAMKDAVQGELDKYWERSRDFLQIVGDSWSNHLAERGSIDAAARRDQLLQREAERLAKGGGGPVIAAGSTGTLPKVAELLRVIARREHGAVVLPGLDQRLDRDAFALIGSADEPMPGHPQFGLKRLIEKIGIARDAVEPLGVPARPAREEIFSLAFRPPQEDSPLATPTPDALDGIAVVEAADAREEALAIALLLRETLAAPDNHAALVTPDRTLARRVCAELTRWNIAVDDSAGLSFGDTEAGRFARLIAQAAADDAAPITLLALLRHPYMHESFTSEEVDLLELACLRGPRPAGGVSGILHAINALRGTKFHRRDARSGLDGDQWALAARSAERVAEILHPLLSLSDPKPDFLKLVTAHRESTYRAAPALTIADSDDAEALCETFDELSAASTDAPAMALKDYADAFPALVRERTVRPARIADARIRILGPLEARMISVSRMVLGGLCESIWPPEAHSDSWLNRPMRKNLKLDLPERRIGLSAHDFVQATEAPELFLVRARKQNGVETIASRFLQRLAAVANEKDWKAATDRGARYLALVRRFEHAVPEEPLQPPKPAPPVSARPTQLSVSDVRDLVRDPYTIFGKHILNLNALEAVDEEPSAAQRGTLLHAILAKFAGKFPEQFPDNALEELLQIGRDEFAPLRGFPAAWAIWWPRFERVATWFVEHERERRAQTTHIHSEISGSTDISAGGVSIKLTARADRIDLNSDGSISILDYKTGTLPTFKEALIGFEPQLALEAAIARLGGFPKIPVNTRIDELGPVKLSGGQPAGEFKLFDVPTSGETAKLAARLGVRDLDDLARVAHARLTSLLATYADEKTSYFSTPRAKWSKRYNDYDHLARIKEWSAAEEDEI